MKNKNAFISIAVTSIIFLSLFIAAVISDDFRLFIKLHTVYSEYNRWKHHGGEYDVAYNEGIMQDRGRDAMVSGLPIKEILSKFPFLTDGSHFDPNSYNGEVLARMNERDKGVTLYWFNADGNGGFAVKVINGIGKSIELYKG
jgi:hypothetical protein